MESQSMNVNSPALFSFDFVVHSLKFNTNEIQFSKGNIVKLCFRLLKFPIISLTLNAENDFGGISLQNKKGKSCLFKCSLESLLKQLQELPLYIFLINNAVTSPMLEILASCYVPLQKLANITKNEINRHKGIHPTCHLQEGCVYLYDTKGEKVGMINITLRLCFFGKILSSHAFNKAVEMYKTKETEQEKLETLRSESHLNSTSAVTGSSENKSIKSDRKDKFEAKVMLLQDEEAMFNKEEKSEKRSLKKLIENEIEGNTDHSENDLKAISHLTSFQSLSQYFPKGSEKADQDSVNRNTASNQSPTDTFESLTTMQSDRDKVQEKQHESIGSFNHSPNEFETFTNEAEHSNKKSSDLISEHLENFVDLPVEKKEESYISEDLNESSKKSVTEFVSFDKVNDEKTARRSSSHEKTLSDTFESLSETTIDESSQFSVPDNENHNLSQDQRNSKDDVNYSDSLHKRAIPETTTVQHIKENYDVGDSKMRSKIITIHYNNRLSIRGFNDFQHSNTLNDWDKMKKKSLFYLHLKNSENEYVEKRKVSCPKIIFLHPFCHYCNTRWDNDYTLNTTQPTPLIWKAETV